MTKKRFHTSLQLKLTLLLSLLMIVSCVLLHQPFCRIGNGRIAELYDQGGSTGWRFPHYL